MKKLVTLIILLAVLIAILVAAAALAAQRPADWRVMLERYLTHSAPPAVVRVHSAVRARSPWAFSREMGHVVFYDGRWSGLEIPFPPSEIWCVLVEHKQSREMHYNLMFITYHSDNLWRYGWLVHEKPEHLSEEEVIETLNQVGCDLDLPLGPFRPTELG